MSNFVNLSGHLNRALQYEFRKKEWKRFLLKKNTFQTLSINIIFNTILFTLRKKMHLNSTAKPSSNIISVFKDQGSISPTSCFCVAFTHADPKSAKRQSSYQCLFALLGSASTKVAHKMLVELTPGVNPIK